MTKIKLLFSKNYAQVFSATTRVRTIRKLECINHRSEFEGLFYISDNLETVFQRGLESLVSFDEAEFQTSFSPWEEYQINESIEKILREKYPNADEAVSRFQALSRSLRDISVCELSIYQNLLSSISYSNFFCRMIRTVMLNSYCFYYE